MTSRDLFQGFPEHARAWVYASADPIPHEEAQAFLEDLAKFTHTWTSHGRSVTSLVEMIDHRFVVIAGFVDDGGVSGCGIDASVRAIEEAASRRDIRWASPLDVFFRDDNGQVRCVSRATFRRLAREGLVGPYTLVFDPSVVTVSDFRHGRFEGPAGETWHRQLLPEPLPST